MDTLRKKLETIIPIDDTEWGAVSALFTPCRFAGSETIHLVMDVVYYLASGAAKSYFYDADGKEFIWQFYYNAPQSEIKNSLMDDCVSYLENRPGLLSFEALEDTLCYRARQEDLEKFYARDGKWQYLARILTGYAYANAYHRVVAMMSKDASDRLRDLMETQPEIFEHVRSYHIAAYLGIAPQSLSRLRKKMNMRE
ncbi:Crp/Fnr family transcriptional regulator [Nitratifractor sp.]